MFKSLTVAGLDPAIQPPRVGAAKKIKCRQWILRGVRDSFSPRTRSELDGRVDALPR